MVTARGSGLAFQTFHVLLSLACLGVVFGSPAQADLITDLYPSYPNLEAAGICGGYTASNGVFWAEGVPTSFSAVSTSQEDLMPAQGLLPWSLSILANIDPALTAPMAASGTVSVYGSTTGTTGSGQLLLEGDIEALGASISASLDPMTTLFQFSFRVTGGAYAADYGSSGLIILSPGFIMGWGPTMDDTPFVGDFRHDFQFNGPAGVADIVPIPEPGWGSLAFALLAAALATVLVRAVTGRGEPFSFGRRANAVCASPAETALCGRGERQSPLRD
jgi:hypothetical protein